MLPQVSSPGKLPRNLNHYRCHQLSTSIASANQRHHVNTRILPLNLQHRRIHLLAIGQRTIGQRMLLHHLRDGVLDTQAILQRTVDSQHGHIFHAQRAGRGGLGLFTGSAADDQYHLAARRIVNHTLANLSDWTSPDLLIILGELPTQRHRAVRAECVKQIIHRIGDAVRRLVKHNGAAFAQQCA